jgi:glycosyltransferase involved in cell wall biosynthesis
MWPHYREAVVAAMDRSQHVSYTFMGSGEAFEGIPHMQAEQFRRFLPAPFKRFWRRFSWQPDAIRAALSNDYDAIIYLADFQILSTWLAAAICRLRDRPVLFWGHGWRRRDWWAKWLVRSTFYRLSHRLLVYAERGRKLGADEGFPANRIITVYNSLDLQRADGVVARIEAGTVSDVDPRSFFRDRARPLLIFTARLIPACRFDLLIEAAALLGQWGVPVNVLLVGEGPECERIATLAHELGIDLHLYGACYEENVIGQLIYKADLTVSPGKIGLTAMHSLMYGTPAITHDNLDKQMPEVEAIKPGVTGMLFSEGSAASLAEAIKQWLATGRDRSAIRDAARAEVRHKWNPDVQAAIIERAVLDLILDQYAGPMPPSLSPGDKRE